MRAEARGTTRIRLVSSSDVKLTLADPTQIRMMNEKGISTMLDDHGTCMRSGNSLNFVRRAAVCLIVW